VCGIFGIITNQNFSIGKVALEGIKRLEYRGYDSCGIVVQFESKLLVKKDAGKVDEIHNKIKLDEFPNGAKLALAHTRWATHGPPTKINAHPHLDCSGKIAVIHNGILENFIELKAELKSKGHTFKSDTDTEVISHLIEEYMNSHLDFKTAVARAISRCEGAYGVAICHADYSDNFIVVRKESPIVIGIEEGKISGLVGENGAGKSTLMSILAGVYRPDNGKIILDEKELIINSEVQAQKEGLAR